MGGCMEPTRYMAVTDPSTKLRILTRPIDALAWQGSAETGFKCIC